MCQYGTLIAHAYRIGATPVLSDAMKQEMLKHFPHLKVKSVSEIQGCKFNWVDIETKEANILEINDVMVHFLHKTLMEMFHPINSFVVTRNWRLKKKYDCI